MARPTLLKVEDVREWVARMDKPCEYCISDDRTQKGRQYSAAWTEYKGVEYMPRGKRLLLKATSDKATSGVHVFLAEDKVVEKGEKGLVVAMSEAQKNKQKDLDMREFELNQREAALNLRERDVNREHAETSRILDQRYRELTETLSKRRQDIDKDEERSKVRRDELDGYQKRVNEAEQKTGIAATIGYGFDKLNIMMAAWRMGKNDQLPRELRDQLAEGMSLLSASRYYKYLPDGSIERRMAQDFLLLPGKKRVEFIGIINRMMVCEKRKADGTWSAECPACGADKGESCKE